MADLIKTYNEHIEKTEEQIVFLDDAKKFLVKRFIHGHKLSLCKALVRFFGKPMEAQDVLQQFAIKRPTKPKEDWLPYEHLGYWYHPRDLKSRLTMLKAAEANLKERVSYYNKRLETEHLKLQRNEEKL